MSDERLAECETCDGEGGAVINFAWYVCPTCGGGRYCVIVPMTLEDIENEEADERSALGA